MTTYPLPTLGPTIDVNGISIPSYNDILLSLIAQAQSIFGSDIYITPDTQDYQLLSVVALAINDQNQAFVEIYNGFAPTFSQGANLSSLVKINGLRREPGTNSTATVAITGTVGTLINGGIVQDTNGNLWALPPVVTIPISGTISVTATAVDQGAIVAAANTITKIQTVVRGWQTVTNPDAAVPGVDIESDALLRQRQSKSTALPSQTPLQSILAAVANVTGVERYAIYENDTGTTDANGVPGHSISLVVKGGDITQIAQTIEAKKNPGTGTYGTTSVQVTDPAGLPITINFFELDDIPIFVTVTIEALPGYVSTTGDAIVQAIVDFINGLPIGSKLYYSWMFAPANLDGSPLQKTFNITALTIGIAAAPVGVVDIPIAFNAAASCVPGNVVINVV